MQRYTDIKKEIRCAKIELSQERAKFDNQRNKFLKASIADSANVVGSGIVSTSTQLTSNMLIEHYANRVDKAVKQLCALKCQLIDIKNTVNRAKLNETELHFVVLCYFKGLGMDEIAWQLGCGDQRIQDIKHSSLKKIKSVIK